ncbi:hypothetical protein A2U01_0089170, partial [Trifolium medium]|nr:hypothetical protein [Trifolium medium]
SPLPPALGAGRAALGAARAHKS